MSYLLALDLETGESEGDPNAVGTWEISDLAETRFSPRCANLVENTNTNVKTRIDVVWVAPSSPGMGCILLRATVMQHRDVWFMDDGFLSKRMCEEEADDIDTQPSIVDPCCACDEAKYEVGSFATKKGSFQLIREFFVPAHLRGQVVTTHTSQGLSGE